MVAPGRCQADAATPDEPKALKLDIALGSSPGSTLEQIVNSCGQWLAPTNHVTPLTIKSLDQSHRVDGSPQASLFTPDLR